MSTCPYCRTENEPGAVRCRHCTSWMVQPPFQREWYRARNGRMIAGAAGPVSPVPFDANQVIIGAEDNGVNAYQAFLKGGIERSAVADYE